MRGPREQSSQHTDLEWAAYHHDSHCSGYHYHLVTDGNDDVGTRHCVNGQSPEVNKAPNIDESDNDAAEDLQDQIEILEQQELVRPVCWLWSWTTAAKLL